MSSSVWFDLDSRVYLAASLIWVVISDSPKGHGPGGRRMLITRCNGRVLHRLALRPAQSR